MENPQSRRDFDVIVVGAGVMGSSTAYQTAKRGLTTLLLEQFDFLHHRGSSHGESRTIRATYPEDYYSGMVLESTRLWQQAEDEIGYKVYFKTRQLDMGPAENKSLLAVVDSCRRNSIPARVLVEFYSRNNDRKQDELRAPVKLNKRDSHVLVEKEMRERTGKLGEI